MWFSSVNVFLALAVVQHIQGEECGDIDAPLCDLMKSRKPEMCGDPCMNKFCKRSCGLCALQCYNCVDIDDVSNCTTVTTCQDSTDYCFTAQTFTAHFTEAYRLGCGSRQTCLQYTTKRSNAEAGCCNTDKCNNKPPVLLSLTLPTNYSTVTPSPDPSVCMNMDDEVCTRLALLVRDPCSDDCISSKICPHMCRKCFYCLDCNEVEHPDNCTVTTACGGDKECYGLEKLGSNLLPAVQLGCIDSKLCQTLQSPDSHIFGKRDFSFKGSCCIGDKCNGSPVTTTTASTTTTTPAPLSHTCNRHHRHCPVNFMQYGMNCFLYDSTRRNKSEAEDYCRSHCSLPFSIDLRSDLEALHIYMARHMRHSLSIEVYTDMIYTRHDSWSWKHGHISVDHSLLGHSFYHSSSRYCAIAYYEYDRQSRLWNKGFRPVDCSDLHNSFCKLKLG